MRERWPSPSDVKLVAASGSDALIPPLIERVKEIEPGMPLYVFSEFPPEDDFWIPYHPARSLRENYQCCNAALRGKRVRYSAVLFEPRTPYWRMRLVGFLLNPLGFVAFNENLDHWMLRPRSIPAMARHGLWRLRNSLRLVVRERGWVRNLGQPRLWAKAAGIVVAIAKAMLPAAANGKPPAKHLNGVSVVVLLPISWELGSVLAREFGTLPTEILAASDRAYPRYSHFCILAGEELLREGILRTLHSAFSDVPDLFSATIAPLRFSASRHPVDGEVGSYVIGGHTGHTMYSSEKLESLGGFPQIDRPVDLGYRAWRRGWSSVLAAPGFRRHVECPAVQSEHLRLLARLVASPRIFLGMWNEALAAADSAVCKAAWHAPVWVERPPPGNEPEERFLALCGGDVAVFPGRFRRGRPLVLVASPYLPYPLAHGGAVRIYHLMRQAAESYDQVLIAFVDQFIPPPPELLEIASEIVHVRRVGSHLRRSTQRPDVVEEFDSPAFRAALRQTVRKWNPAIVQLEFTQMAQYARDAAPSRTVLVEHDITYAFHQQLLEQSEDWETRRQMVRWKRFETEAWHEVDAVVTMSEADRRVISGAPAASIPNGVDLGRFQPSGREPDPARLLFVGPCSHLPNVLAIEFFLEEVWPLLANESPILHLIAGRGYRSHLRRLCGVVRPDLARPGVEIDEFVDDIRTAYERATLVIAPLQASAGTKIKILEAMAAGKAIVTTPSGIRGLNVTPGIDVLVGSAPGELAASIFEVLNDPSRRKQIEQQARATAERFYGWDRIAERQDRLYRSLIPS
ncbi:MAG: glycosyltransferase family 4 protein [Bryobacteraceae bacterium]